MTQGSVSVGIIGKHPGYGDFVQTGLSEATTAMLTRWIDHSFGGLRDSLGNAWPEFWDQAHDLRFWVGPAVTGKTLAGILRPSRDKVGRRYPFLLIMEGAAVPSPMQRADQSLWDDLDRHLNDMQPGTGARALLDGFSLRNPPAAESEGAGPTIWAHRHDGDLTALLASAGPVEQDRAQLNRSHWWSPGSSGRAATWLACPSLPLAPALGWLLSTVEGNAVPPQPASDTTDEAAGSDSLREVLLSDVLEPPKDVRAAPAATHPPVISAAMDSTLSKGAGDA